jgi:hypothetical protein
MQKEFTPDDFDDINQLKIKLLEVIIEHFQEAPERPEIIKVVSASCIAACEIAVSAGFSFSEFISLSSKFYEHALEDEKNLKESK